MSEVSNIISWHDNRLSHSSFECLQKIPAHWDAVRLRYLASEPLAYGANEAALEDNPNFPRFIRITDINEDGSLRSETFKSLPIEIAEPYLLNEGDILLARSGATVGKAFIYRKEWGQACFAGYLIRFRCNRNLIIPDFLYAFTQCDIYWSQVREGTIQATIQNFSAEKYGEILIPLPPLCEQRSIAQYLDRQTAKIDTLITAKQYLLNLLAEKRRALITHAVTRGLNADVLLRDSGIEWLGEIPRHWEIPPVHARYEVQLGKMLDEKKIRGTHLAPYLRNVDVQWDSINTNDLPEMDFDEDERLKFRLKPGDILVCEGGEIGRTAIWRNKIDECYYQKALLRLRPVLQSDVPKFFVYVMRMMVEMEIFASQATSSTIKHLTAEALRVMRYPAPPYSEQLAIVAHLDNQLSKLDALNSATKHTIELLQERRIALISAAVTGQIRIPT